MRLHAGVLSSFPSEVFGVFECDCLELSVVKGVTKVARCGAGVFKVVLVCLGF